MIATEINHKLETVTNEVNILPYWVWGVVINDSKSIVFTSTKKRPLPKKYCYLIFTAECALTDKDISIKNALLPSVGDVCGDNDGNRIQIVSIN